MKRVLFILLMVLSQSASSNVLENTFDKFAYVIFKAGWPTAKYVDHEFFDVNLSERYVTVKMNGISYWSDGNLNMLLKVTFNSNYGIDDVDVVRSNGLVPPFATLEILGEIIKESNTSSNNSNYSPTYATSSSSSINNIRINNECHKPVNIAVRYMNTNDNWVTDGWWEFSPSEKGLLRGDNGRLETDNSILYYFAQSTDKTIVWEGDKNTKYFKGKKLDMREVDDENGDIDITLVCNK